MKKRKIILAVFLSAVMFYAGQSIAQTGGNVPQPIKTQAQIREEIENARKQAEIRMRENKVNIEKQLEAKRMMIKENREGFLKNEVRPVRQEIQTDRKDMIGQNIEDRKEFRVEARVQIASSTKENREATLAQIKEEREKLEVEIRERREAFRKEAEAKMAELKEKREEMKVELRKKIANATVQRIENALRRLDDAVERYMSINSRIEIRIQELEKTGSQVPEKTKSALSTAKEKASLAITAIELAKATLSQASNATSTDLLDFKSIIKTAEESVKSAREATTLAISTLKGLGPVRTATTTPSN